tara:strand:+ start:2877 stop:3164 length:288 start_codon:yes stop_codon:yes gene_type:complete
MGLTYIKDVVATTGKYINAQGESKNSYQTCGKMFERDDSSICIKLDAIPLGNEWDGWLNMYDKKEWAGGGGATKAQAAPAEKTSTDSIDGIPFEL